VQIEGEVKMHVHPASIKQALSHPSRLTRFPSSQFSSADLIPSPHKEEQTDQVVKLPGVQVHPGKTPVQVGLHPV